MREDFIQLNDLKEYISLYI